MSPADQVKRIVLADLKDAPPRTGVLLSSGVDSQLVLRALVELEKRPVAISFRLDDRKHRDWEVAEKTARELNVPFLDVTLPTDLSRLRGYVYWAVNFGLTGKAAIECFWPRMFAINAAARAELPAIATGDGGDGYHGLSKKAMIHFRDDTEKLDEFRRAYFAKPNWSQNVSIRAYALQFWKLRTYMPLADPALLDLFLGRSWEECNKPKQKRYLREAFDLPTKLPIHQNLQLGDSGIAELFTGLTPEGRKSPISFYNEVIREAGARPDDDVASDTDVAQTTLEEES